MRECARMLVECAVQRRSMDNVSGREFLPNTVLNILLLLSFLCNIVNNGGLEWRENTIYNKIDQ